MTLYAILFLNVIFFSLLRLMEFDLLIEKINYLSLFNILIMFSLAIYATDTSKKDFHIHTSSIFILLALIIYNTVVLNKPLLIISVGLFLLYFILDYKYNSIKLNPYKPSYAHAKAFNAQYFKESTYTYEGKEENEQKTSHEKTKKEEAFEEDINEFMINMKLEESLVLLGLSHEYTLKQLKEAYKAQAHKNHPDKFPDKDKNSQTIIMKEINEAKSYLEDRLKKEAA